MKNKRTLFLCLFLFSFQFRAYSNINDELSRVIKKIETFDSFLAGPRSICTARIAQKTSEVAAPKASARCLKETTPQLRKLFLSIYQKATNKGELKETLPKLMAMTIKESSGNPVAIADMKGNGSSQSYKSFFKENKSLGIMSRDHFGSISLFEANIATKTLIIDSQTNFGLAQISADRMKIAKWGGSYLKETIPNLQKKDAKNFYDWCLTGIILKDKGSAFQNYYQKNIKGCKASTETKAGIKCFGRLVSFCPRLNIELALKQPKKYFETRHASALCSELFK